MKYDVTIDFYGKKVRFKGIEALTKELAIEKAMEFARKKVSVSSVNISDPFEDVKKMFDFIFR